jgi:hypothetical protein
LASTGIIVVLSSLLVFSVAGTAFLYPQLVRPEQAVIVTVDSLTNGETDDVNFEYRAFRRPESGLLEDTFVVRIANLGMDSANNLEITLEHKPESTDWYRFLSTEKTFGDSEVDIMGERVLVRELEAGKTISLSFTVVMNMTLIEVNNALQDRSQLIFQVVYDEGNVPDIKTYSVKIPPA